MSMKGTYGPCPVCDESSRVDCETCDGCGEVYFRRLKREIPMSSEPTYDPETCITAAELRASGINVPEKIPDVAWVPKWSIKFGVPAANEVLYPEKDTIAVDVQVEFSEPFRWVYAEISIPKDGK